MAGSPCAHCLSNACQPDYEYVSLASHVLYTGQSSPHEFAQLAKHVMTVLLEHHAQLMLPNTQVAEDVIAAGKAW